MMATRGTTLHLPKTGPMLLREILQTYTASCSLFRQLSHIYRFYMYFILLCCEFRINFVDDVLWLLLLKMQNSLCKCYGLIFS